MQHVQKVNSTKVIIGFCLLFISFGTFQFWFYSSIPRPTKEVSNYFHVARVVLENLNSLHATHLIVLYIHSSVHRNSKLIRSNKMQQYAGIYLLQNHSTCFRSPSHPSPGVHKIVTAASGTGHSI